MGNLKPRPNNYTPRRSCLPPTSGQVPLCVLNGSSTVRMDRCEAVLGTFLAPGVHATCVLQAVTRAFSGERPQLLQVANTCTERCSGGEQAVGMPTL